MKRIVLGIGGASGMPYAARLLAYLAERRDEVQTDVVFSRFGRLVWAQEVGTDPAELGFSLFATGDMTAPFASGSARYDGMAIVPCSASGLARIASGATTDLLGRAADVMLKERRPLVLAFRETPLSLIHIRNMGTVTEAGALVLPLMPSFYSRPRNLGEALDTVNARILDHLGIENTLSPRWAGMHAPETP